MRKGLDVKKINKCHSKYKKINFLLEQDEDGYPPFGTESMWGIENEFGLYKIDNLPFYVYGISLNDEVSVYKKDSELIFKSLVKKSSNSTIRIFSKNEDVRNKLEEELESLGCKWEFSNIKSLSSINIPKTIDIKNIEKTIEKMSAIDDTLEYEISCLRQ